MIKITIQNIKTKFEFFRGLCIEECLEYLRHSIPDQNIVHIIYENDENYEMLDDCGGALCDIRYNKHIILSHIYIPENVMEFNKKHYPGERDRRETFLESIEVPFNEYSLFLLVLLHEFGHANLVKQFHDAGIIQDYTIFDSLSDSLSDIFERRRDTLAKWEDYYDNVDLPQLVNGIESQCDIFARDNFLPLWKSINKSLKNYTIRKDRTDENIRKMA